MDSPHFIIKNKFQKRDELYSDILTTQILKHICKQITGRTDYTCEFNDEGYNKGRLAILEYQEKTNFISFSEDKLEGRNSAIQSFPTALVRYHQEKSNEKKIFFYFLPTMGNYETPYLNLMYRLMKTAGVKFLNEKQFLTNAILPFTTVDDIIANREINRAKNKGNNSTYLIRSPDNIVQIYGKTYGANKYETTLLCLAFSKITKTQIELYEICEGNLKILPGPARKAINALGKIKIIPTDLTMEREEFEENNSLRSPKYTFNLLERLGDKKCGFCGCEIPQIIEGAHIWPVADIKKEPNLNLEEKLKQAIDGNNGIWLCQNHHKLFDLHIMNIAEKGDLEIYSDLEKEYVDYIKTITPINQLAEEILTPEFIGYLEKRNGLFQESQYTLIAL